MSDDETALRLYRIQRAVLDCPPGYAFDVSVLVTMSAKRDWAESPVADKSADRPELHPAVEAAGGENLAVRGQGECPEREQVPVQRQQGRQVQRQHDDRAVGQTAQQVAAVRVEGEVADGARQPGRRANAAGAGVECL